jgi:hypothetical protein
MCDVFTVIFGACGSVGLLYFVVVAIRKWSIDPVSNPKPRRDTLTRDSKEIFLIH